MHTVKDSIEKIAEKYKQELDKKMKNRRIEIKSDNFDHYLIYNVLGISNCEGKKIDEYQNMGRFLYKYAGSFLEEVTQWCFQHKFKNQCEIKVKIPNTQGNRPKKFEIDCLVQRKQAYEIKWRDATTDGDHITKEHTRIKVIASQGFIPIRLMFYYPNRTQAQKIQATLETLYQGIGGEYYKNEQAWEYIRRETGIDLLRLLKDIVLKNS